MVFDCLHPAYFLMDKVVLLEVTKPRATAIPELKQAAPASALSSRVEHVDLSESAALSQLVQNETLILIWEFVCMLVELGPAASFSTLPGFEPTFAVIFDVAAK